MKPAGIGGYSLMQATNIENIVVDEANQRTYVILAPRVLSDGEIYRAIRQEIRRRGGKPLASGETLTLTLAPGSAPPRVDASPPPANGHHSNQPVEPDEPGRTEP